MLTSYCNYIILINELFFLYPIVSQNYKIQSNHSHVHIHKNYYYKKRSRHYLQKKKSSQIDKTRVVLEMFTFNLKTEINSSLS